MIRADLRRLGQTTKVERSTLNQVRQKIAELRAKSQLSTEAKQYDFDQRLAEIRKAETERKEKKKNKGKAQEEEAKPVEGDQDEMMAMMGFGNFSEATKR